MASELKTKKEDMKKKNMVMVPDPEPAIINKIFKDVQNGSITCLKEFKKEYPCYHWSALNCNKSGDTLLHIAAKLGYVEIIRYLLDNFESRIINCKNKYDKTPLHEACQFGQLHSCELLLFYGADVNVLKVADWTPLMLSCTQISQKKDCVKIVDLLLRNGALVNYTNKDGWSTLHLICREGNVDILNLLIKNGLNIFAKTKNGRSGLHVAALHSCLEIVKLLIKLGLNVNEKDNCGNTSLHEAVLSGNIDIIRFLIGNNADVSVRNNADYGLIHLAASQGHLHVVNFLIKELNWNVNETNSNLLTALHCAARKKHVTVYKFLVDNGANEQMMDKFHRISSDYLKTL